MSLRWFLITTIQKIFRKIGYDLRKLVTDSNYVACPPYAYKVYAPYFESQFKEIYDKIRHRTLVTEDRCYVIRQMVLQCSHLEGSVAEAGAYKGGTAYLIAKTLDSKLSSKKLHVFDSFEGMPTDVNLERDKHKPGDFNDVSFEAVSDYLSLFPNCSLHKGFIPNTFEGLENLTFCFVHIDVDIYDATVDSLNFFYSRLVKGGVIIFDDYGFKGYEKAEKKALDDFFKDKKEEILVLRTGQAMIIKL